MCRATRQARLNLTYTPITAPIDAWFGDRSLRPCQLYRRHDLLTLVPMVRYIYLVANFQGTQCASK